MTHWNDVPLTYASKSRPMFPKMKYTVVEFNGEGHKSYTHTRSLWRAILSIRRTLQWRYRDMAFTYRFRKWQGYDGSPYITYSKWEFEIKAKRGEQRNVRLCLRKKSEA